MSETESRTVEGAETPQEGQPSKSSRSLLKRAGDVLTTPVGKLLGGAMIVGAVAGATREAVADMVACASVKIGDPTSIILDKINGKNQDNIFQTSEAPYPTGEVPLISGATILTDGIDDNYSPVFIRLNADMSEVSTTNYPLPQVRQVIGEIGVGTDGETLYHFNGISFVKKGISPSGYNRGSYGGYMFVQGTTNNVAQIRIVSEDKILNHSDPATTVPFTEWNIGEEPAGSTTDGFAIDSTKSTIVVAITRKSDEQDGYMEIPLPELNEDGELPDPNSWAQDYPTDGEFVPTPFVIHKIYIDTNGDRYFISRNGEISKIHIQTEDGRMIENAFEAKIKILLNNAIAVTVLPSGGLYIVEEGESIPLILKRGEVPTDANVLWENGEYALYESPDFPGNGSYGVIKGCNAIAPEWEPEDPVEPDPEPVPEAEPMPEPTPDVIEPSPEVIEEVTTGDGLDAEEIEEAEISAGEDSSVDTNEDTQLDIEGDVSGDVFEDEGNNSDDNNTEIDSHDGTEPIDNIEPIDGTVEDTQFPYDQLPNDQTPPNDPGSKDPGRQDNPPSPDTQPHDQIQTDQNPSTDIESRKGGSGCTSVPNGVNDTRGSLALILATLAALSGSRWRRREEDEVKLDR